MPAASPTAVVPNSRKAEATRQALLDAARVVIARDGFVNARIADIAREAGKAVGVFYTYFSDKTVLFAALVEAFHDDLKRLAPAPSAYEENTAAAIKLAVRGFWSAYRQYHPEMLGLLESGLADPALQAVWRKIRGRSIKRFAYRIRRQQEQGMCQGLNAELAASALAGMLEFTCFNWHSKRLDFPGKQVGDEEAVETLYRLIAQVLELPLLESGAPDAMHGDEARVAPKDKPPVPAKRASRARTPKPGTA